MLSYTDSASAREVKGSVPRRGLCGDVYLVGAPRGPRIASLRAQTSVRRREITIDPALEGLAPEARYTLRTRIMKDHASVKEFASAAFPGSALQEGRMAVTEKWMPEKLWDLDFAAEHLRSGSLCSSTTPPATCSIRWPARFGFREFWIDGKDFRLNGSRFHLSAVPLDNALIGAAYATYEATRETLRRLKSFGINYVYTHNYDCEPGFSRPEL